MEETKNPFLIYKEEKCRFIWILTKGEHFSEKSILIFSHTAQSSRSLVVEMMFTFIWLS